jgi:hypothetical protein
MVEDEITLRVAADREPVLGRSKPPGVDGLDRCEPRQPLPSGQVVEVGVADRDGVATPERAALAGD